jgi:hypothetical protein
VNHDLPVPTAQKVPRGIATGNYMATMHFLQKQAAKVSCLKFLSAKPAATEKQEPPPRRWYRLHPDADGERYFVRPDAGMRGRIPGTPRPALLTADEPDLFEIESKLKKQLKRARSLPATLLRRLCLAEPEGLQVDTFQSVCRICYDAPVEVVVLPCRHGIFCETCLRRTLRSRPARIAGGKCPVCTTRISEVVWIFGEAAIPQYGYTIRCS